MAAQTDTVILLAEDDAGHAALIERNLRRAGIRHPVQHFPTGDGLLRFVSENPPAHDPKLPPAYLLLLDIRMPGMDGIQLLREIKSRPDMQSLPTIMFTTSEDPKEIETCRQLGCDLYVTKPIEYDRFVEVVGELGKMLAGYSAP